MLCTVEHAQECSYLFDSFLPRLFNSPEHLKVGFGFDTDLKGAWIVDRPFVFTTSSLSVSS